MAIARVFKSGNSQAVRLPKKFRVKSAEVEIFRRGDEIVLREKAGGMVRVLDLLADLPADMFAKKRSHSAAKAYDERPLYARHQYLHLFATEPASRSDRTIPPNAAWRCRFIGDYVWRVALRRGAKPATQPRAGISRAACVSLVRGSFAGGSGGSLRRDPRDA